MPLNDSLEDELEKAYSTRYREAEDQLKAHLINLVRANNLVIDEEIQQRVGTRSKSISSIVKKIDRGKPRKVKSLPHLEHTIVTDIVGGRVVLNSRPQVRQLCKAIKECSLWEVTSTNGGKVHPDTGYRSYRFNVTLFSTTNHSDINCEIQVRSILQHAFATFCHPIYEKYREDTRAIPDFLRGRLRQVSDDIDSIDKQIEKLQEEISELMRGNNI